MAPSAKLADVVSFCTARSRMEEVRDFPGAENGLQVANPGRVTKIGAAVDGGLVPFRLAVEAGVDFLIVHHGMFWDPARPITGSKFEKLSVLLKGKCALFSCHLPLDAHPEIGNNALLARALDLKPVRTFLPYEGTDIGTIVRGRISRGALRNRLRALFSHTTAMEYGSEKPAEIAILTGSGMSAIPHLRAAGVDTFVTGELKQAAFNTAQEERLNLYCCGHYETETFGVKALAAEVAAAFDLPWTFLDTGCPL
jgi:dinuclear metal center YbgI/SA1388 family protein